MAFGVKLFSGARFSALEASLPFHKSGSFRQSRSDLVVQRTYYSIAKLLGNKEERLLNSQLRFKIKIKKNFISHNFWQRLKRCKHRNLINTKSAKGIVDNVSCLLHIVNINSVESEKERAAVAWRGVKLECSCHEKMNETCMLIKKE